jgi:hypothetical protein
VKRSCQKGVVLLEVDREGFQPAAGSLSRSGSLYFFTGGAVFQRY